MESEENRKTKQLMREMQTSNGSSKLEWLYTKKSIEDESEDYLLGKRVDKSFASSQTTAIESRVGICDIPQPTLRASSSKKPEQLDNQKAKEDPLFVIKQREEKARLALLNHPMRIKQMQKQKEEERKQSARVKSGEADLDKELSRRLAKLKKRSPEFLDDLLNKKLQKLKGVNLRELLSENSSSSDSDPERLSTKRRKSHGFDQEQKQRRRESSRDRPGEFQSDRRESAKSSSLRGDKKSSGDEYVSRVTADESVKVRIGGLDRLGKSAPTKKEEEMEMSKRKDAHRVPRVKLTSEEMERRRQEMEDNAKQRDKDRARNVARYKEEAAKEDQNEKKQKDPDFLKRELVKAASISTIEGRIKANVANIQRGSIAMEKNFARR